jgi:hypothetical protein
MWSWGTWGWGPLDVINIWSDNQLCLEFEARGLVESFMTLRASADFMKRSNVLGFCWI